MAERVGGLERVDRYEGVAFYGDVAGVTGFRPGSPTEDLSASTVPEYLRIPSSGAVEMEHQSLDGALPYVVAIEGGEHAFLAAFGAPDSKTVFMIKAGSSDDSTALVRAFVEAAAES